MKVDKIWKRILYGVIGAAGVVFAFNLLPAYTEVVKWITIVGAANWLVVAIRGEHEKDVLSYVDKIA